MGEEEEQEREVSMNNTSTSKKGKKKARRVHHCKRVMIATNDQSQRSYLSLSRVAATGYQRKIRDLLINNKSLAKALAQSESLVSKLEKEIAQLQWQINIRSVVNMKLNQASGKLSGMATLLKETASIVMEAINCSHTAPIDESLTTQSLTGNTQNMMVPEANSLPQDKNEDIAIKSPFLSNIFAPQNQVKTGDMSIIEEVPGATEELLPLFSEIDDPKGIDCRRSQVGIAPVHHSRHSSKRKSSVKLQTPPRKSTPSAMCETPKTPPLHLVNPKFKSNIPKPKIIEIKKTVNTGENRTVNSPVQRFNSPVQRFNSPVQCFSSPVQCFTSPVQRCPNRLPPQTISKKKITPSHDKTASNSSNIKKSSNLKPHSHATASTSGVTANALTKHKLANGISKTNSKVISNNEHIVLTSSSVDDKVKMFSEDEQKSSDINLRRHTFVVKKSTESKLETNVTGQITPGVTVSDKNVQNRRSSLRAKHLDFKDMDKETENVLGTVGSDSKLTSMPQGSDVTENIRNKNSRLQSSSRKTHVIPKLTSAAETAPNSEICTIPNSHDAVALCENSGNATNISSDVNSGCGVTAVANAVVSKYAAVSQEPPNVTICAVQDMSLTEVIPHDIVVQIAQQNQVPAENTISKDVGCLDFELEKIAPPEGNACDVKVVSQNDKQGSSNLEAVTDGGNEDDNPSSSHVGQKLTRKRKTTYVQFISSFDSDNNDPDFNLESKSSTRSRKSRKADSALSNGNKPRIRSKKGNFVSLDTSPKKATTAVSECEKKSQSKLKVFDFSFTEATDEPLSTDKSKESKRGKKSKHKRSSTSHQTKSHLNDDKEIITDLREPSQKKKKKKATAEVSEDGLNKIQIQEVDAATAENEQSENGAQKAGGGSVGSNVTVERDNVTSKKQTLAHLQKDVPETECSSVPSKRKTNKGKKTVHVSAVELPDDIDLDLIDDYQANNVTKKRSKYSKDNDHDISNDDNVENVLPKIELVEQKFSPTVKIPSEPSSNPKSQADENDFGDFITSDEKTTCKTKNVHKQKKHGKNDPVKVSKKKGQKLLDQPDTEIEQLSPSVKKMANSEADGCNVASVENKNILKARNSPCGKHKADVQLPSPSAQKNLRTCDERNGSVGSKISISDANEMYANRAVSCGRPASVCSTDSDNVERTGRESRRRQPVSYKEMKLNSKLRRP